MIGSLRNHWTYTMQEIWDPLLSYKDAPEDLFIDLFDAAEKHLGVGTPEALYEQIRNDPVIALVEFKKLKGTDFESELSVAEFLEVAFEVIEDYAIVGLGDKYKSLLRSFIAKYNLRYRLDDPFDLRFLLTGSFANLYNDLRRINGTNVHLQTLWSDFEESFDDYSRDSTDGHLRTTVINASKYAEGLASVTASVSGSLGDMADLINEWPHPAVKQSLKNLYGFCSDFPAIRHSGNPASASRNLDSRDSILISVLFVAFSGYLTRDLNKQELLGG